MMIDASKYTITVRKGIFDGDECFQARIAEFPDICEYGESFDEAYSLAIDSVETTAVLLQAQGKSIPAPIIPADNYSGRVTLRLPKSLHRALVNAADNEGISLNQHLTNVLNYYTGYAQATTTQQHN
jgi:predicted HicB family RNase H-like nuclease